MVPLPDVGRYVARLMLAGVLFGTSWVAGPAGAILPDRVQCGHGRIAVEQLENYRGCDLTGRVVHQDGVALTVPPPGIGVAASAASAAGADVGFGVQNLGTHVELITPGEGHRTLTRGARQVPPKCSDSTYKLSYGGHPWAGRLAWSYQARSTPAQWRVDEARDAVLRAGRTVARGGNACNLSDRIDAGIQYLGYTTSAPEISSTETTTKCGRVNTANVVGWGELSGANLGFTCFWWNDSGMIAADIMLQDTTRIVRGIPQGCRNSLDLQSLATHEWGHAFGLDHVGPEHANLVMPHLVATCSKSDRTLGLGDYLGLKELYGTR